jgi:hypothetical protein
MTGSGAACAAGVGVVLAGCPATGVEGVPVCDCGVGWLGRDCCDMGAFGVGV